MRDWRVEIRKRLKSLSLTPSKEAEIIEELRQHLEDIYIEARHKGASDQDAIQSALHQLDDSDVMIREWKRIEVRAENRPLIDGVERRGNFIATFMDDLRYAVRSLRKSPGFTLLALFTLALGIGANTAMFSIVHTVLIEPLPFPDPSRLVTYWLSAPDKGMTDVPLPQGIFAYHRDKNHSFDSVAAYAPAGFSLTDSGEPERLNGTNVTLDFFRVLGVQPVLGRMFSPEEDTPGKNLVTILSHRFWQRRFAGESAIIGRSLNLNGIATQVVGVMPKDFDFPNHTDLWVPVGLNPATMNNWYLTGLGRMKTGVTLAAVRDDIATLTDRFWPERQPNPDAVKSIVIAQTLADDLVGEFETPLITLLGAVGLVLLIACANIANLLLGRAAARSRQVAVRYCLGASPARVFVQSLTESVVLAIAGAAVGLMLASWTIGYVKQFMLRDLPRIEDLSLDTASLLFTVAVAVSAGLLFGSVPAWKALKVNLQDALKESSRTVGGSVAGRRWNNVIVVSQFALCVVLLVGAVLLLRSFQRLQSIDPGFRSENLLIVRVALPFRQYGDGVRALRFYEELEESVKTLPGVTRAALSTRVPFTPGNNQDEFIAEGKEPAAGEAIPVANLRVVTSDLFQTLGISIVRGRGFERTDTAKSEFVSVIDETVAQRYWPNEDPIGKRIRRGNLGSKMPWLTIVGVARSVKHSGLDHDAGFYLYMPMAQNPQWGMYIVVKTSSTPELMTVAVRKKVWALDSQLPVFEVHTMEDGMARTLHTRRLTNSLLAGFAATALLLAAVGIYGVMALNVSSRIHEFGIRVALGAQPGDVVRLVTREGLALAGIGVAIGLAGAYGVVGFFKTMLFQIQPEDPTTFVVAVIVMATVAFVACYIPARRATRIDPVVALRAD